MNVDSLVVELIALISDLGKDGGKISGSVYDTAQVLRYMEVDDSQAVAWMHSQQCADGGWGNPDAPYARFVPTIAAILALQKHGGYSQEIEEGLAFVEDNAHIWSDFDVDILPVATELILPSLIRDANAAGLSINSNPFVRLAEIGERRMGYLSGHKATPGSAATYSWEAWGDQVEPVLLDHSGGVGHSPSATAAWLAASNGADHLLEPKRKAHGMIEKAARSTGFGGTHLSPIAWPITGFEISYSTYAVCIAGLAGIGPYNPLLPALQAKAKEIDQMIKINNGMGFGEMFTPDADDTATAMIFLNAMNMYTDDYLAQFKNGDHYVTYRGELNPSVFTNAHAVHAKKKIGGFSNGQVFGLDLVLDRQQRDGRWLSDKWHASWIYTTLECMISLDKQAHGGSIMAGAGALIANQKADGGWGFGKNSTRAETSYALIALQHVKDMLDEFGVRAIDGGYEYLRSRYAPNDLAEDRLWIAKELYTPYRIDRVYELCALLSITLEAKLNDTDA
jgi:hypothetical protein